MLPRCPLCCEHGVPLSRPWCSYCEDRDGGYLDAIADDEPMWLCPHGVGVEPGGPFAVKDDQRGSEGETDGT